MTAVGYSAQSLGLRRWLTTASSYFLLSMTVVRLRSSGSFELPLPGDKTKTQGVGACSSSHSLSVNNLKASANILQH